jgi:hypothetical protein
LGALVIFCFQKLLAARGPDSMPAEICTVGQTTHIFAAGSPVAYPSSMS